jgi:predicted RNA-binding protein with PIN domain
MPLLIDGYNLLHASGILGRGRGRGALARSREALLNVLAESLPAGEIPRTVVVFDAHDPPWGLSRQADHRGLTIYFASRHADADTMIEELINAHSAPRKLVVVSSDHRVQRAAKRRRATAIDSDRWFGELMRARQEPSSSGEECLKPEGPFSPGEVEFWLRQFTSDAASDAAKHRGTAARRRASEK